MLKVVVVGAGVSGLTTAVDLLKNGYKDVTVIGQYIPGDMTTAYTSPWAGASILSFASSNDVRLQEIDADAHKVFKYLAENVPESSVIHCPGIQFNDQEDEAGEDSFWVRKIYPKFQEIPKNKLPEGVHKGYTFETYTLSVPKYLKWLVEQVTQLGGKVQRVEAVDSLQQVIDATQCDILINCTAMGAAKLVDVRDSNMYTVRGQTILVEAPHIRQQIYRDGSDRIVYIIPRGDGTVICGGTMDTVNKNLNAEPALTKQLLEGAYSICPELTHGQGVDKFKVVSVNVGFRPGRKGGIRLEKEVRVSAALGKKVTIVHNYGHSSHGYQSSWGCSQRVVKLLNEKSIIAKL
ncbi:hypothetical protein BDA99DRAFT_494448 [Phascolomyces articulosus]|uniref:FAD dependent oxidoreductase domain-containing protein n=1 Tax=Phascolomyces articulosus TaxID=60185 RepID=A0AAD5PJL4_9FUNG|nr:hypothetical protein BDA99DRAFT_494448 [Phascolomyces articulosus]